jgi:hypothetical protein
MQRQRHTALRTPLGAARWFGTAGVVSLLGAVSLLVPMAGRASAAQPTAASGACWVRFGHFASGHGPIKVSIDGRLVSADAKFETVTPYQAVTAGPVTIKIVDIGKPSFTLTDRVKVAAGDAVTVGALRSGKGIMFKTFDDNLSAAPTGDAKVRALDADVSVHSLSVTFVPVAHKTSSPAVTARTSTVLHRISYASASPYIDVAAGHYNVTIRNRAGKTVLEGRDWPVATGTVASLIVVRSAGVPTLEVLDDAAGATSAPVGGMQTGFGGMSLPSSHGDMGFDALMALAGLLLVGAMWRRFSVTNALSLAPVASSGGLRRHRNVVASAAGLAVVTAVSAGCGDASRSVAGKAPRHAVAEGAPQASPVVPMSPVSTTSTTTPTTTPVAASTRAHTRTRAHAPATSSPTSTSPSSAPAPRARPHRPHFPFRRSASRPPW